MFAKVGALRRGDLDVSHQPLTFGYEHHGLDDAWVSGQHRFDLAELDSMPAQF